MPITFSSAIANYLDRRYDVIRNLASIKGARFNLSLLRKRDHPSHSSANTENPPANPPSPSVVR